MFPALRQVWMLLLASSLVLQAFAAALPCPHAHSTVAQAPHAQAHHHHSGMPEHSTTALSALIGDCLQGCDCPGHCGVSCALPVRQAAISESDAQALPPLAQAILPPLQAHGQSRLRPPISA